MATRSVWGVGLSAFDRVCLNRRGHRRFPTLYPCTTWISFLRLCMHTILSMHNIPDSVSRLTLVPASRRSLGWRVETKGVKSDASVSLFVRRWKNSNRPSIVKFGLLCLLGTFISHQNTTLSSWPSSILSSCLFSSLRWSP